MKCAQSRRVSVQSLCQNREGSTQSCLEDLIVGHHDEACGLEAEPMIVIGVREREREREREKTYVLHSNGEHECVARLE